MLLNEEINSLLYIEQHSLFLDDTCSGCLLEELRKKKDIQTFFKNVITESIENLEINFSNYRFNFNIDEMNSSYLEEAKNKKKNINNYSNWNYLEKEMEKNNNINTKQNGRNIFNIRHMFFLNKQSLEKYAKDNKLDKEKSLYDLYEAQINNTAASDPFLYSNKQLFLNIDKYSNSENLLYLYQNNFTGITNFINLILDNIINNFNVLPYSIKFFCKIISLMVKQKFPEITKSEELIFLAKFFFGRLLIPILRNPGAEAFINSIIISENTLYNLQVICDIINKFVAGGLFTGDHYEYTPFNWYFIEQSEKIYKIFECAKNVSLPPFIEDCIYNKLPNDFKYDYFQQNKDELINFRSICFNMREALALINSMEKCKTEIFEENDNLLLKKAFEKITSKKCKNIMNEIINKENKDIELKQNEIKKSKEKLRTSNLEILLNEVASYESEIKMSKIKPKIYYVLVTSLITSVNN